jgi:xanthine/CO dehydrogenase XdhC/CoxF family maturation factor
VIELGKTLGWRVTVVVTPGASPDYRQRFVGAEAIATGSDDEPLGGVRIDDGAAVVLMTHNYPRDLLLLPKLISRTVAYLGILGPRRRTERLVLEAAGVPADAMTRIHAPVGLDLGATTPQAIALSIVAEIQAVLAGRPTISLRDRPGPIYPETHGGPEKPYTPGACPMSA